MSKEKCCKKCSVNRPRDVIEKVFEIDCTFCSCHIDEQKVEEKKCDKCGRTSEVVELNKNCPFCVNEPKQEPSDE